VLLLAFVGGIVLCRMTSLARLPTAWLSACGIGFLLLCALDRCRQPESAAPPPAGCGVAVLTGGRQMTIGCEQLLLRAGNRLVALAYLSPLPTFERLQPDFARMVGSLRLRSEKGP
jgi:hypothetical protein